MVFGTLQVSGTGGLLQGFIILLLFFIFLEISFKVFLRVNYFILFYFIFMFIMFLFLIWCSIYIFPERNFFFQFYLYAFNIVSIYFPFSNILFWFCFDYFIDLLGFSSGFDQIFLCFGALSFVFYSNVCSPFFFPFLWRFFLNKTYFKNNAWRFFLWLVPFFLQVWREFFTFGEAKLALITSKTKIGQWWATLFQSSIFNYEWMQYVYN